MVLKIFAALAGLVKVRLAHTDIDSYVFRLHYRMTASILFIACGLVAATEYIGGAIQCLENQQPAHKAITTFCWIQSTFTINTTDGLGNHRLGDTTQTIHAYYQWVPFVLFIQGCFFYLPHLLWKTNEGKTAVALLQGLQRNSIDADVKEKRENIIKYIKVSKGRNRKYLVTYYICEILNLVNVLGQLFLLDAFFGGTFMNYGVEVLDYIIDGSNGDPFMKVFPKQTKCNYYKIGPSGTLETRDILCILPQNILNEKVFVILWFWFVILATITAMQLVWLLVMSLSPTVRIRKLEQNGKLDVNPQLQTSIQSLELGDFFLLDVLGKNLDAMTFKEVLTGAILDENANTNTSYNHLKEDDEDPASFKRRMEMDNTEEGSV